MPFAALHQLLRPLLKRAQGLARPQRDALLATFGMEEVSAPDPFLVALGSLELVAEEARKAPLLVIVDDAHWLDASTTDVLGFIARRLGPEPVVLLIAARDGYETALVEFGLPELRVEALDDQSSRALLDSHAARSGARAAGSGAEGGRREPARARRACGRGRFAVPRCVRHPRAAPDDPALAASTGRSVLPSSDGDAYRSAHRVS